jgi:hypothetical protein
MVPVRCTAIGPTTAVSVPAMLVSSLPNTPVISAENSPPSTGRRQEHEIALRVQIRVQADVGRERDAADLDLPFAEYA